MTFAIAKTRQHEFYPIWGAEVRRKMQINCRIIAEQDWQKSAREPSRCIYEARAMFSCLHISMHHLPQCHSATPYHSAMQYQQYSSDFTAMFSCLHIFWEIFTCLQLFASPHLHLRLSDFHFCIFVFRFVFLYFCFHICICFFFASPRLFS